MRIALFCPNWVGDLVMATPAFRAIRSHFPEAEIAGVMRPYLAGVLEGTDLVDRVLPFDAPEKMSREAASYTLSEFRRERFDARWRRRVNLASAAVLAGFALWQWFSLLAD